MTFDPYHRWLGIPKGQRPPTYYQLLGIAPDETDVAVIEEAALRQTIHVRTYQTGPHGQQSTALLNEIGMARATLVHPDKRRDYDARLWQTPSAPVAPSATPGSESAALASPTSATTDPGAFAFDQNAQEQAERFSSRQHARHATVPFWAAPGALLYLVLLGAGGGIGYWASTAARPAHSASDDSPNVAPIRPPVSGSGKKASPRRPSDRPAPEQEQGR